MCMNCVCCQLMMWNHVTHVHTYCMNIIITSLTWPPYLLHMTMTSNGRNDDISSIHNHDNNWLTSAILLYVICSLFSKQELWWIKIWEMRLSLSDQSTLRTNLNKNRIKITRYTATRNSFNRSKGAFTVRGGLFCKSGK